ncbi:MAG: COX15/CtaA family protein [Acidimicrobiales bacterium]
MAILIRPTVFSRVAATALAMLCVIVLTGALVRLTGSGLGCTDWPRCNEQKFVDVSSGHAAIEQVNRLFTGLVSASVMAAVLTAHLRRPRRRDLIVLAWALVAGVLAQVVIGGIVVLTGLNPWANMAHFLVSMVLVGTAFALDRLSRVENVSSLLRRVPTGISQMRWLLVAASTVAVGTGTVVTATGPHAGDENAERFGLALESVARVHGTSVVISVAVIVTCMWKVRTDTSVEGRSAREALTTLAFVSVLQGAVGYTQYLTGVPVFLVAVHIAGATAFWLAVCNVLLAPRPDELLPAAPAA